MADTVTKRHPIRAALWGFVLGLAVTLYLTVVFPVIGLDTVPGVATKAAIVIVVTMVVSVLWGLFGPAKKPKGRPPASAVRSPITSSDSGSDDDGDDTA